jgi:hypothetical protein
MENQNKPTEKDNFEKVGPDLKKWPTMRNITNHEITAADTESAANILFKSERGRNALHRLINLIDAGADRLDIESQDAALLFLAGVFQGHRDVLEAIRAKLLILLKPKTA